MTLKEFYALKDSERGAAYEKLSDHDKFLSRLSEPLNGSFSEKEKEINKDDEWLIDAEKKWKTKLQKLQKLREEADK